MKKTIVIEGMMCQHCAGRVQKALTELDGVGEAMINLDEKSAVVTLQHPVDDAVLTKAVSDAGYTPVEVN